MNSLMQLSEGFASLATNPVGLLWIACGVLVGIVSGAIPGLTATMGIAILIPITFSLDPEIALGVLIAVYCGGLSAGAVPAVLLNIPGTPSAMATTLDGYPMAKNGQSARALGWALIGSVFGGFVGWIALVTMAPMLARLALKLGSAEYAALSLFGLSIVVSLSQRALAKGLLCALLGLCLSMVGFDPLTGDDRWTFGTVNLFQGISFLPALIGLFAIPEILTAIATPNTKTDSQPNLDGMIPPLHEILQQKWNLIRSAVIGVGVGIIPAIGGSIASLLAYAQSQRFEKDGKEYGTGRPGGVVATETANNGVTGGALIPLFTVGIPGDAATAMLVGGLMIHGLQPGPQLFATNGAVIYTILAAFLIANVMMFFVSLYCYRYVIKILTFPKHMLYPGLLLMTVVGSFALNRQIFDVGMMLGLGLMGFVARLGGFPVYPIVLGLVLGPIIETETRRALLISGGDWSVFVSRPVSLVLIILTFAALFGPKLLSLSRKPQLAGN
ncbi:MAG: hypothetical protein CMF72_06640 [Mameliella sp.]|nr:hypothetical protein [Mameliella sp.]